MAQVRDRTLGLVDHLDDEALSAVHSPIMSPLAWDLGHIGAFEDLWLNHRLAGRELLRPGLAELYDAFETPRAVRGDLDFLHGGELREYLQAVRERSLTAPVGDGELHELVIRHELQHGETMLQTLRLAGLEPPGFGDGAPPLATDGTELVEIGAGLAAIGSPPEGFAYDNERPRHTVDVAAFAIGRDPVSNAAWARWVGDGGYEREAWWSPEGWAWRREAAIEWRQVGADDAPALHVSWYEADAFARAQGARLPTEVEWEKAASAGALDGLYRVWEWTASEFTGYPGFVAHPYREYSEVFFGEGYRVLRGGSVATDARIASPQFRNWDLPRRRQLFAGVRIAR